MNMVLTPPLLPIAAALSEFPSLGDSIAYQLNGLVVVFAALSMIWVMLEVLGLFFKRQTVAVPRTAAAPVAVATAAPSEAEALAPELLAAMAAAVHETLGAGYRVTTVVPAEVPLPDWAREGRRQIHSARKVR